MTTAIDELDVVEVTMLLEPNRRFSGTEGAKRAPRISDLATIVHVLEPGRAFIAEAVDDEGYTLWVADFCAEELKLKTKYRPGA
jgi:hypothetical protein